jgi:hypothetical protein
METKHIVCYSGGHSSALVAIEVVKKYGKENVILLNHNINSLVENKDIKRFKQEVADYLGIPITYANHDDWENKDQFDIVIGLKGFKFNKGTALCTYELKTKPFEKYLNDNFKDKKAIIYYGFDKNELHRVQRRSSILAEKGYKSDYPLALWERTILSTKEIEIEPPNTYSIWKHANCTGCLKAGKQHWYLVYLHRPDLWEKAKYAEEVIGYSILKDVYLEELEEDFYKLKCNGVETTEHEDGRTFMARARKVIKIEQEDLFIKPCECFI